MTTRKQVMGAVDRVSSLRGEYVEADKQSAEADLQHWEALREPEQDQRTAAVDSADLNVADKSAASTEAFEALGKALVDMHALAQEARRDEEPRDGNSAVDRPGTT